MYEEIDSLPEILDDEYEYYEVDEDAGRISLCTLGSINWGAFRNPEDTKRACRILLRSLNNILDYQDFLSVQSQRSNDEIRPIGIGVTNLAYWHAKRGLKYGDTDSLAEIKSWQEHIAYYLTESTVELAKERGPCEHSHLTWYGRGVFPWERRANGVNELTDFTPELDWEILRENMKQYGVRNSTLMAVAPVESCQSWRNLLNFADGSRKNFHEMLEEQSIDWRKIESEDKVGVEITLNSPIEISGRKGVEIVEKVVYNGFKPVNTIIFEDGSQMNFTDNHRLLVNRNGKEEWVHVFELREDDDVIQIENESINNN